MYETKKEFSRLRNMLPGEVSDYVIKKIIKWVHERLEVPETAENFLLDCNTHITYGKAHHLVMDYGPCVNIYQLGLFGYTWVFDPEDGEIIGT